MSHDKVRILIVDDHPLIRLGVIHLLRDIPWNLEILSASNHHEAAKLLRNEEISLAICDISLPDGSGLELIKNNRKRHPAMKWLVLSVYNEPFHLMRAKSAGANGFIGKDGLESELIDAVKEVMAGREYPEAFKNTPLSAQTDGDDALLDSLSEREFTVFRLIAEGKSVEQIAASLSRSPKTINALRDRIRAKLRIDSSAELNRFATQWYLQQRNPSSGDDGISSDSAD